MSASLTRRDVLALGGGALLAAALPAARAGAAHADARAVYRSAFVLDANTLASVGLFCCDADTAANLDSIRDSGLTAFKSTLGGGAGSFEEAVADIAAADNLVERFPDRFLKVIRHADFAQAQREHRIAIIYSFEAASMLDGKVERIELFRRLGVRVMQLGYNRKSPFGCGCLDGDADGVTDLGRQAIAQMNELGVALDLSHANTRTTADGIAASKRPSLITHAGCRAVFQHPRNKEDREMKALADKGGVMGIYMLPFLTPDDRQPKLADYLAHMRHALDVCGEDHVGIGTDSAFFTVGAADLKAMADDEARREKAGIGAPGENRPPYIPDINTPRKLERVADGLLAAGYGTRVVDKVLGDNFNRAFKEIWSA
ncbi:MAG TPA: membrane dipeptidase [Dokdonella sp.]